MAKKPKNFALYGMDMKGEYYMKKKKLGKGTHPASRLSPGCRQVNFEGKTKEDLAIEFIRSVPQPMAVLSFRG